MAIQLDAGQAGPSSGPYSLSHTISAHTRAVTALRFSGDGRTLVSAGADGYVHFWNAQTGEHQRALQCHRAGINDISLSPDSLYLVTASDDCTSLIFTLDPFAVPEIVSNHPGPGSISQPFPLRTLAAHTAPVLAVAFSPKSNLIATGSFDESAIVWDVRRGRALRTIPAHAEAIWTVGWDAEGALVLTGSADGLIRLWDANTGQCLKTLDNESNSPVSHASFTPSSFFILSSSLSSTVRVYNLHTGKVLKTLRAQEYVSERYPSPALVFGAPKLPGLAKVKTNGHSNGTSDNNAMDVDEEEPGTNVIETKGGEAWVIAGSENGTVIIWDLQERRVLQLLTGHQSPVVALAIHPDGRTIATGSLEPDRSIKLWQAT